MLVVIGRMKGEIMAEAMAELSKEAFKDMFSLGYGYLVFLCGLVVLYAIVYTIITRRA